MMAETTQLVSLTTRFHDILKKISQIVENGRKSKTTSRILRSTLKNLSPLVQEIKQYNQHLNPPREEITTLINQENEDQPACKCSHNKLYSWFKHNMNDDSVASDDKQESITVKDVKDTLYEVREILKLLNKVEFEHKLNEAGNPIKCPFGVPEKPEFTVGLEEHLSKLKRELLRDGNSTSVLTGLGGSGKTTLATRICLDEQVKDCGILQRNTACHQSDCHITL